MKIVLTNKGDGRELLVDADSLKLVEVAQDGTGIGSHIVFAADLARNVNESVAAIAAAVGVNAVAPVPAGATAAQVAKLQKK